MLIKAVYPQHYKVLLPGRCRMSSTESASSSAKGSRQFRITTEQAEVPTLVAPQRPLDVFQDIQRLPCGVTSRGAI